MDAADAERACAYVIDRVKRRAGVRWAQGQHAPTLELRAGGGADALRVMAEVRLWKVERHVAMGLVAWANGERDVELLTRVPQPREVLELQARGRRCVSLLPEDAPENGLDFVLHDVCHLEKFVDPRHHRAQVGFFQALCGAMEKSEWASFDGRFDAAWHKDLEHVAADMNGSAIFLFAALKMKLKMAVRRELARNAGRAPPSGGPLDTAEARAFGESLETMLDTLGVGGEPRDDARAVSTKRDARDAAERLERWFVTRSGG